MSREPDASIDRRVVAELRALDEFFMGTSKLHEAAAAISKLLAEMGIDHALAGAVALGIHGFRRATEDIDVLITREGLERFKEAWRGRGYVDLRPGGKAMRDTIHDVKVDFLLTGDYPGDGLPKPVAFPDPAQASIQGEQFRVLGLAALVELKLASAMSAPHRGGDFFDVVNLVRRGGAAADLREQLNPYVRAKFDEAVTLAAAAEADDY